jgi:hypothetical protein
MHRAAMVVMVSWYAFGGTGMGMGLQPGIARANQVTTAGHTRFPARAQPARARAYGRPDRPMAGFDICTAPSIRTMRVWRARFSAAGIYIGGENKACGYGYLSGTWVRTVKAMGWSLLPIYVGPQPPCDKYTGRIHPKQAAAQGRAAADGAIADANMLGIGRGSPVYYDMEAYNRTRTRCVNAVLTFLDAWTRQLDTRGYVSGVYSSADAAIADLQSTSRVDGHRLIKPQCVWIALWDNRKDMNGSGYLISAWPRRDWSKQYSGPHWVKVGVIKLYIDSDLVDGPVVRDRHRTRRHHWLRISRGHTRHRPKY